MMRALLAALAVCAALIALPVSPAGAVQIQRMTSPLGVDVWYVREPSLPIIAVNVLFQDAGASTIPVEKLGLGYMTQVLLDEGAGDMKSFEFQRRLDELSLTLDFNASVDTFGITMRTLSDRRDDAFKLLGLAISKPRFDEEAIERMRTAVLSEVNNRLVDPDDIINRAFVASLFPNHGYSRPLRGVPETLEGITRADLVDFVKTRFTRDKLVVGAVGDVPIEEVARLIDLAVADLPAKGVDFAVPDVRPNITGEVNVIKKDIPQSTVLIGSYGIKREDPDYYAAAILNAVMGGASFISRLWDAVREERGLAYSVQTSNAVLEHGAYFLAYVATNNEKVAESISVIRDELDRVLREGITQAELDAARTYLIGSFALSMDTNARIASTLVSIQVSNLPMDYMEKRADYYNAVTLADIQRVARRVFLGDANAPNGPPRLNTVVIGDPANVAPVAPAKGG
mgnify:CR=1 FL=1